MGTPDQFPHVSIELLEALDRLFPERCPDPSWADRDIWRKTGNREVVRFLRAKFDEQNETVISQ
jgi:hypothetical protein